MKQFNKKRFMKYRSSPLFCYCCAVILTVLLIITVTDIKIIPDGLELVMIFVIIMMWAIAIDSNLDSHSREIKDMIKDRLPKPDDIPQKESRS